MRKITENVVGAFVRGERKSNGNTATDGTTLTLHGNVIARKNRDGTIEATLAGWPTVTTRERLNGLCQLLGLGSLFCQIRHNQWCGLREIDCREWVVLSTTEDRVNAKIQGVCNALNERIGA